MTKIEKKNVRTECKFCGLWWTVTVFAFFGQLTETRHCLLQIFSQQFLLFEPGWKVAQANLCRHPSVPSKDAIPPFSSNNFMNCAPQGVFARTPRDSALPLYQKHIKCLAARPPEVQSHTNSKCFQLKMQELTNLILSVGVCRKFHAATLLALLSTGCL